MACQCIVNRRTIIERWPRFNSDNRFVAVKALTGHMTDVYERAVIWEAEALRLVSQLPTSLHCTQLLDEFTIPGKGSAGSHMCFVTPVYGGDVKVLIEARRTALPLPLARRIALHLLRGIAHAHERGIVHTDLKHCNIFFPTTMTADDIEAWVTKEPSRRHAPEVSHDGAVQAAVSQPLPMISEDEAVELCGISEFFLLFSFTRLLVSSISSRLGTHDSHG